jgi:hypothetical protein
LPRNAGPLDIANSEIETASISAGSSSFVITALAELNVVSHVRSQRHLQLR